MESALATLAGLPAGLLYPVLFAVAALENFVPPFPADVIVAFGAFVAAQGEHPWWLVFVAAWLGNVCGALAVYSLGRRFGARRLERQVAGAKATVRDARLRAMVSRYGMPGLFLARFVPGVRALVPAVAGALRLPPLKTGILLAGASIIWYGAIVYVAFRVGGDWPQLRALLGEFSRKMGVGALALLTLGLGVWAIVLRRRSQT